MGPRRKQDKILSQLRTPAQVRHKTDQPKSKDVLADVSTEEGFKRKEDARNERKRQVQPKLEYQLHM